MKQKFISSFIAMSVAGIWIAALCTAPQILGNVLWRKMGISTELPLRHLLQVSLNSLAVLTFILVTRRGAILVLRRPEKPLAVLFLLPLVALNLLRGPLADFTAVHFAVILVTTLLIGFWEEFLFRGLIQERLSVMGPRLSILFTALLFASIHFYRGPIGLGITFSIGLAFCLTRARLGMWTLVVIHCLIDFNSSVFVREWPPFQTVAYVVIGVYLVVGLVALVRMKRG